MTFRRQHVAIMKCKFGFSLAFFSRWAAGFHRRKQVCEINFCVKKNLSSDSSNQVGKIVLTADQFAQCPSPIEIPEIMTRLVTFSKIRCQEEGKNLHN